VSKAFSTRLPSLVFSNWKMRPHFEQCPEITMPLASLFTTYILGFSAMPTVFPQAGSLGYLHLPSEY
jgi:hypothetical protein